MVDTSFVADRLRPFADICTGFCANISPALGNGLGDIAPYRCIAAGNQCSGGRSECPSTVSLLCIAAVVGCDFPEPTFKSLSAVRYKIRVPTNGMADILLKQPSA